MKGEDDYRDAVASKNCLAGPRDVESYADGPEEAAATIHNKVSHTKLSCYDESRRCLANFLHRLINFPFK